MYELPDKLKDKITHASSIVSSIKHGPTGKYCESISCYTSDQESIEIKVILESRRSSSFTGGRGYFSLPDSDYKFIMNDKSLLEAYQALKSEIKRRRDSYYSDIQKEQDEILNKYLKD